MYKIMFIAQHYLNISNNYFIARVEAQDLELSELQQKCDYVRGKIQRLNRIICHNYRKDPERLRGYFNAAEDILAGLATSAYFQLTGDMRPCLERMRGGLGAIVSDSVEGLDIGRLQFPYSTIRREAFRDANAKDFALMGSKIIVNDNRKIVFADSATNWAVEKSLNYVKEKDNDGDK